MRRKQLQDIYFLTPGFAIYTVFMVVPVVLCLYYSITNWDGFSSHYRIVGLANFKTLLTDRSFLNALRVTLLFTVVTTVTFNVVGIVAAALLDKVGRTYGFCRSAVFIPNILSPVVVAFIWSYMIQQDGGVINAVLGVFGLPGIDFYHTPLTSMLTIAGIVSWNGLGFYMVIYSAILKTIPEELTEASVIDGAGALTRFFRITLPLMVPAIKINCILAVTGGLKQYDHVKVITAGGPGGATETITLNAVEKAFSYNMRGYSSAIVLVLFLLIVLLTVLQLRVARGFEVEY